MCRILMYKQTAKRVKNHCFKFLTPEKQRGHLAYCYIAVGCNSKHASLTAPNMDTVLSYTPFPNAKEKINLLLTAWEKKKGKQKRAKE